MCIAANRVLFQASVMVHIFARFKIARSSGKNADIKHINADSNLQTIAENCFVD